jgi:hypothetical protein
MSRAYRVSVKECVNRVIKAEDRVSTQLEILEVLPPEQMAELLAQELVQRGFERNGNTLTRTEDGVTISVEIDSGTVTVSSEGCETAKVQGERVGRAYDDVGPQAGEVRQTLREDLKRDLQQKVDEKTAALQSKVTDRLEGKLTDLREELDQAVNRVTGEALKRKAASLGQIKELTEDPETGSMTIVVEV